jgi:hypothetical protein
MGYCGWWPDGYRVVRVKAWCKKVLILVASKRIIETLLNELEHNQKRFKDCTIREERYSNQQMVILLLSHP